MKFLIWQILIAVTTMLLVSLQCQSCYRRHRGQERRVVPVRVEQRPAPPYVSRGRGRQGRRWRVVGTRTIALATLPMPIRGTIEVPEQIRQISAEASAGSLLPAELRFPPPDAALMRRVLEGLRALPDNPREAAPRSRAR
jgi:hypothetical protein